MKKISLILITVVYFAVIWVFVSMYLADVNYVRAQKEAKNLNFTKAILLSEKSIKQNPFEPRYRYGAAKIYLAESINKSAEETLKSKISALRYLREAESLNPQNLVTLKNIVPIYYFLAVDLKDTNSIPGVDNNFLGITRNYLLNFKNYNPQDVSIYTLVAKYEDLLGQEEMLRESKDKISKLRPDLLEWYITIPE